MTAPAHSEELLRQVAALPTLPGVYRYFDAQDQVVIEAQQRLLGNRELDDVRPVMFASDAAAIRARKQLARLIRDNAVPTPENPNLAGLRTNAGMTRSPVLPAV